jgi:hypothetical protein
VVFTLYRLQKFVRLKLSSLLDITCLNVFRFYCLLLMSLDRHSSASLNSILPAGVSVGSGATLGITVIIAATIGGFIGGSIITTISALLDNWLAPRIGGIKLEFE